MIEAHLGVGLEVFRCSEYHFVLWLEARTHVHLYPAMRIDLTFEVV